MKELNDWFNGKSKWRKNNIVAVVRKEIFIYFVQ